VRIRFDRDRELFGAGKKPAWACCGEYEFLQKETAWKIVDFLLPEEERDVGFQRFFGSEPDALDSIADAATSRSLFDSTRVLLVYEAEKLALVKNEEAVGRKGLSESQRYKNFRAYEKLVEAISGGEEGVHLVFIHEGTLKKPAGKTGRSRSEKVLQRCYPELDKHGVIVDAPRMFDDQLLDWMRGRAAAAGIKWDLEKAEMFMDWAGKDVRHLANEVEKLSIFFGDRDVESREMRRLVTSSEDFFVNYMIDFIFQRRAKAALASLERSVERGAHPVFIVSVLASRLRQLWQARYLLDHGYFASVPREYGGRAKAVVAAEMKKVKDQHAAALADSTADSILRKTPYAVYHLLVPAQKFSLGEIEDAISATGDVDRRLKAIVRPKRGSDQIMLQSLITDIVCGTTGAAAPS